MAGNQIASLFAKLGFDVNYKGLREFEQSLQKTQKRINSSSGLTGDFKKAGSSQSDFYKKVTQGYAKVKPTLEDHRRNLLRIREGFKQNKLSAEEYRNARLRTLHAISQAEKRVHRERMARMRREQKAQGPFAGGQDPRQRGTHGLISALHSDVGLSTMFGGFALAQSTRSFQEFVGMERTMAAATGSMEEGQKEMQWLIETSNKLGISLRDAGNGYKNFLAATKDTELAGSETRKMFEAVSAYGKVLNMSSADVQGSFRGLVQMVSKGRIQAEELRGQLGERLVGAYQATARAMDMTTEQLAKATEQGELTAEDVFPKLRVELMKMANSGGMLEKSINDTSSALNRLGNNLYLANVRMQEAGLDEGVRKTTNALSDFFMRSDEIQQMLGSLGGVLIQALRGPIELFGAISDRMGVMKDVAEELGISVNVLLGGIAALFRKGRKLLVLFWLLPNALSGLGKILDGEKLSWAEWALTLGGIVASLKAIKDMKGKIFGKGGSPSSAASAARTGGFMGALAGSSALNVAVVSFMGASAIGAFIALIRDAFRDPSGNTGMSFQQKYGDITSGRSHFGEFAEDMVAIRDWFKGRLSQTSSQTGLRPGMEIPDQQIIPDWMKQGASNALGSFDRWAYSMPSGGLPPYLMDQSSQAPISIGNIDIRVESNGEDNDGLAERIYTRFMDSTIRTASMNEPMNEK